MPTDPLELPDDDPPRGNEGGGGPFTGSIGGGGVGGGLFGDGGFGGWQPFYSGQGGIAARKRRWNFVPGQQGGTNAAMPAAPGQMFAGRNADPFYSILNPAPGPRPGNRPGVPPVPRPPAAPPGAYQPGSAESGYIATGGAFDVGKFLADIGSGKYFDSQNDVLSQLLDQRAVQDERNAIAAANSEFPNDPSLQGYARVKARIGSGKNRTQGLLAAKKSQQDFVNELYRALGMGQMGHKINVDMFNKMKPDDASDFEKFLASLGGLPPIRFGGKG